VLELAKLAREVGIYVRGIGTSRVRRKDSKIVDPAVAAAGAGKASPLVLSIVVLCTPSLRLFFAGTHQARSC
jgi:hypothetical protein